jgi:hypothetical protein
MSAAADLKIGARPPMVNMSPKTFGQRISQAAGPTILRLTGALLMIVMVIVIAGTAYELVQPYWESVTTFGFGYLTGWLAASHTQRSEGLTIIRRCVQARGLVLAGAILLAFGWRNYELAIAWRSYGGHIASFSVGFVAGLLVALRARWEKGWRMNPGLQKALRPIAVGAAYTGGFIYLAVGSVMIFGALSWLYESIVSHWKPIACCIGGICIGGLALLVIAAWFSARRDRMRNSV